MSDEYSSPGLYLTHLKHKTAQWSIPHPHIDFSDLPRKSKDLSEAAASITAYKSGLYGKQGGASQAAIKET